MSKALIIIGSLIILHTLIAFLTKIPFLTDYLPIDWFPYIFNNQNGYLKIVPTKEPTYFFLYIIACGIAFIVLGFLINFKKRSK